MTGGPTDQGGGPPRTRRWLLTAAGLAAAGALTGCRAGAGGAAGSPGSGAATTSPAVAGAPDRPTGTVNAPPVGVAEPATPAPTPPDPGLAGDPFRLGVASGDPAADGVVLWTRLAPDPLADDAGLGPLADADVELAWDVATDDTFSTLAASGVVPAPAAHGHSVHVEVSGLQPDAWYRYRFRLGAWTSAVGRTRTAPAPDAEPAALVLAACSCQHWEHGTYVAHRHLAAEGVDVVLWLGDFIYEGGRGSATVRDHPEDEAVDLAGYRRRYALYRSDADLQAAQAAAPWIVVWDDHEVQNNYAAAVPADGADPAAFDARRAQAYQAWWENQPVRLAPPVGSDYHVYRDLAWGRLARFLMLDGRSARSPQECEGAVGDACDALAEPSRTMLGDAQEQWVTDAFARAAQAGTTWTVLGNQTVLADLTVPVGRRPTTLFDQWDGYPEARRRLLTAARRAGVANLVALTGDLHCSIAAELELDGVNHGSELVASSISSIFPTELGSLFELGMSLLGNVKLTNTRNRGYLRGELGADQARFSFRHVADPTDTASGITTTSTWVLRNGIAGLQRG
ncbi:MAG: alkaline phosphatase [Acidimicrobiia bacterium]